MPVVAIAFGSNVGNREQYISRALAHVQEIVRDLRLSGLYESDPMYRVDQGPFLNGAMIGVTDMGARDLMKALKFIEVFVGRTARGENGPREMDLDIIHHAAGSEHPNLLVPHPRAHERRFVLEPMNEIDPEFHLPGYGIVRELLNHPDVQSQSVIRVADAPILL